jgi:hypothetical protein
MLRLLLLNELLCTAVVSAYDHACTVQALLLLLLQSIDCDNLCMVVS